MQMRLVRNGDQGPNQHQEAWSWERVYTKERAPLAVINVSFSWLPSGSLSLIHDYLNKFNRILNHSVRAPPQPSDFFKPSWNLIKTLKTRCMSETEFLCIWRGGGRKAGT